MTDMLEQIDAAVLDQLERDLGDRETVHELVQLFVEGLARVGSDLWNEDVDVRHLAAHTMSSSAALLGATGLAKLCVQVGATNELSVDTRRALERSVMVTDEVYSAWLLAERG